MGKNNARLPDLKTLYEAGIDPITRLPLKISSNPAELKKTIKMLLRVKEESEFVNRFTWYNLPLDLSSEELERLLYYKGNLCFFFDKDLEKFFIMPYALNGTIDAYGRYNTITPVPMTSGSEENKPLSLYFSKKKLKVIYSLPDEITLDTFENSAVIIRDYTNQLGQTNVSRQILNDGLLDVMSETIPLMRTRLILGTGVKGVRVNDADQEASVKDGARRLESAALTGEAYVPILGNIEFQELSDNSAGKSEEYMMAYQSLDNLRKEILGLPASGVFEKKAHTLQSEQNMNGANVDLVLNDGLNQRQNACTLINSIWGIGIWCEVSETISMADINGDGVMYDENDETNQGMEVENNVDDTNV